MLPKCTDVHNDLNNVSSPVRNGVALYIIYYTDYLAETTSSCARVNNAFTEHTLWVPVDEDHGDSSLTLPCFIWLHNLIRALILRLWYIFIGMPPAMVDIAGFPLRL